MLLIPNQRRWQRPATMAWTGLLARELAIFIGHTYRISKLGGNFGFGWETGRVAASIATGHGFSSPFEFPTGPTAWLAPIYPSLLAGIFKVFGVYSTGSSIAILSLNSVFSALTILPIYYIAKRTFGRTAALWSGWLAALFPYAWYAAIRWAWETSLATLLLACVFLHSMRMANISWIAKVAFEIAPRSRLRDWLLFGVLWGLIALTNPSLLLFLPFCGTWLLVLQTKAERNLRPLSFAFISGLVCIAIVSPWAVRNYRVFHKFIPVRGDFGVELRIGNAEDAMGLGRLWMHPSNNVLEFQAYKDMGEVAYVHLKQQQALEFIRTHPTKFASLCFGRFLFYWYGTPRDTGMAVLSETRNLGFLLSSILAFAGLAVMWRRKNAATFLFAAVLFAVPLIYYITFPHPRYRAPIEPEMLILIVGLFLAAEPRRHTAQPVQTATAVSNPHG